MNIYILALVIAYIARPLVYAMEQEPLPISSSFVLLPFDLQLYILVNKADSIQQAYDALDLYKQSHVKALSWLTNQEINRRIIRAFLVRFHACDDQTSICTFVIYALRLNTRGACAALKTHFNTYPQVARYGHILLTHKLQDMHTPKQHITQDIKFLLRAGITLRNFPVSDIFPLVTSYPVDIRPNELSNTLTLLTLMLNSPELNVNAPDQRFTSPYKSWTSLMVAVCNQAPELIKLLLDHKANPSIINDKAQTALTLAKLQHPKKHASNSIIELLNQHLKQ